MKNLVKLKIIAATVAVGLLSGCGADKVVDLTDPTQFKPVPTCPTLSGKYQMNQDSFSLDQVGCSKLYWKNLNTQNETEYIADNQVREYLLGNGKRLKEQVLFTEQHLLINRTLSEPNGKITKEIRKYYLTKKPCDLINPDGDTYLAVEIFINDSSAPTICDFWTKI